MEGVLGLSCQDFEGVLGVSFRDFEGALGLSFRGTRFTYTTFISSRKMYKCYVNVETNRFRRAFRIRTVNSRVTINNIEEKISTGLYILFFNCCITQLKLQNAKTVYSVVYDTHEFT